ncbi:MAG: Mut7-C RNAse domain-containing protein [Candidatus Cloacimonadales bacterium]
MASQQMFILTIDAQKLAKWLRLLGYDTKVIRSVSLLNLIRIAKKEKRIIITRSKEILKHPLEFERIFIHSDQLEAQLEELRPFLKYEEEFVFTRCPEDNDLLVAIDKEKIIDLIPAKVAELYDSFKICRKCGRVYWQGSHYEKIEDLLKRGFNN